jgi:hypothetical protein
MQTHRERAGQYRTPPVILMETKIALDLLLRMILSKIMRAGVILYEH